MSNTITFYKQKSKSDFEKNLEKLGGFNSERALKIGISKLNNHINVLRVEKKVFKFIKKKINIFKNMHSLKCTSCSNVSEKMAFEYLEDFINEYKEANKKELNESLEKRINFMHNINTFNNEVEYDN